MTKTQKTRQDFFVFLDSDDTLVPNSLEVINSSIKEKECDVVFFRCNKVVNGCTQNNVKSDDWFVGDVYDKRELYKIVFSDLRCNSMCFKSIRCDMFDETDYREFYYLDRKSVV